MKWKGSLFYRFVACLVDDAKCVRELGEDSVTLFVCKALQTVILSLHRFA